MPKSFLLDDADTKESFLKSDPLVKEVQDNLKHAKNKFRSIREEWEEAWGFYSGKRQWSLDDTKKLRDLNRPVVTFNRTNSFVNAVVGYLISQKLDMRFAPEGDEDAAVAELMWRFSKHARTKAYSTIHEKRALRELAICGVTWVHDFIDFDLTPWGRYQLKWVPLREMWWDPRAYETNLLDAKWVIRRRRIPASDFRSAFPDHKDLAPERDYDTDVPTVIHQLHPQHTYSYDRTPENTEDQQEGIELIEYQYFVREPLWRVLLPNGQEEFIEEDDKERLELIKTMAPDARVVKQSKRVYRKAYVSGNTLLEDGSNDINAFTYRAMTGYWDDDKKEWFGLVRMIMDPQRWSNKALSEIMWVLMTAPKGGFLFEQGMFDNPNTAREAWARPDMFLEVARNTLSEKRFVQIQGPGIPAGLGDFMTYANTSMPDVTGVSFEALGLVSRAQPAAVEASRKQQTVGILSTFRESMELYMYETGHAMVMWIKDHFSDGKARRIVDELNQAQSAQFSRDQTLGEFDVIVEESPESASFQEQNFAILTQVLPSLADRLPIWQIPEFIDMIPGWPASIKAKIKKRIAQMSQPSQEQQMMQQLEVALKQAEVEETQAKGIMQKMRAMQIQASIQPEAMRTMAEAAERTAKASGEAAKAQDLSFQRRIGLMDRMLGGGEGDGDQAE